MFAKLKPLTLVSLFMLLGSLYLTKLQLDKRDVVRNGKDVFVTIVDVPVACGEGSRTSKSHFRFTYLGKTHRKNFGGQHCEDAIHNSTMVLKTNEEQDVFLFPDEDVTSDIAAFIGLNIMFAVFIFISERKKKEIYILRKGNYKKEKKPRQPKMGRYGSKI